MFALQLVELGQEKSARAQGVLLQAFFLQDVQNRQSHGTGDRVAAEGAEKLHAVVEGFGDSSRSHHRRERESVSDGLAEDHDVRHYALRFKSPKVSAQTAESDLHLISDTRSAGGPHVPI